ncbi:hypothetical protein [Treponema pedis]|uniref:hypothetical protein n=1 Tax=Treponema pedis TaxID=409322 RepID=UPI0003F75436|nr:hypothetical protein [Treponema pedis]
MHKSIWKKGVTVFILLILLGGGLALYRKTLAPDKGKEEVFRTEKPAPEIKVFKPEEPKNLTLSKTEIKTDIKKTIITKKPSLKNPVLHPKQPPQKEFKPLIKETESNNDKTEKTGLSLTENKANKLNWSLGLLTEANMNTPKKYSFGTGLYAMFLLPYPAKTGRFQIGIKGLYSYNFKSVHTVNTSLLFRWNFYDFKKIKTADSGFFIQAEAGAAFAWNVKSSALKPLIFPLGQGTAGYRFSLNNFFIEPYIYAGYPALWGAGLTAGLRWAGN